MSRFSSSISLKELEQLEQNGTLGYRIPDNEIILNLANSIYEKPNISQSPNRKWLILYNSPKYTPIEHLSANEISVGGIRIHSNHFNKSRGRSYYDLLGLLNIEKIRNKIKNNEELYNELKTPKSIQGLPKNALIRSIKWSPNSKYLSFLLVAKEEIQLWISDVETGIAKFITGKINASLAMTSYIWQNNSSDLFYLKADNKDNQLPKESIPSFSPSIRSNLLGNIGAARTYQNLLKSTYDEKLFKFFTNSTICKISIDNNCSIIHHEDIKQTNGLIKSFSLSPDGKYLLTQSIHEPFSYLVPYSRFPHTNKVFDITNTKYECCYKQELPLQEQVPSIHDSTRIGPRYLNWISSRDSCLYWVEAQDDGDPRKDVKIHDILYILSSPFTQDPQILQEFEYRFYDCDWSHYGFAWTQERNWKSRWSREYKLILDDNYNCIQKDIIYDRSYEDVYNSPGSIWVNKDNKGKYVISVSDKTNILYSSTGATSKGYLPFLDIFNSETKESKRLWRCKEGEYENVRIILDNDGSSFLTMKESPINQPNIWLYMKINKNDNEYKSIQITNFKHPYPWLKDITKELVTYKREDGVLLSGKLLLPANYNTNKKPLPMIIWAYPREFTSIDNANQVKITPSTFTSISATSPIYWVTQGYAVLIQASIPIVSKKKSMENANDGFIDQLISSATTHVNEMVKRGIADPKRIAIGGHSYGAFMTAHLLAHTDLFCAGIARSGAYNRTLTPFGFQSEDRTLWECGDLYYKLSPFNHVKNIKVPLLLIHGELDCNSGTYPEQSIRFYNALKGNGCISRLVILPYEDHGYKSKENILHLLWEMDFWLNTFCKNNKPN